MRRARLFRYCVYNAYCQPRTYGDQGLLRNLPTILPKKSQTCPAHLAEEMLRFLARFAGRFV